MATPGERWSEVAALFDECVELAPDEQARRLADLERVDAALAAEVRSLLAADVDADSLLDAGVAAAVPDMLTRTTDPGPRDGLAGPYRLLRLLGEGGMGVVWLAERTDGAYEQQVAVKLLKLGMDTQAILRRFLQERRILARLHHPHIVRLMDGGMSSDGRPYYVMEFVDGLPITEHAARHGLAVRARVELLAQVAEAVAYAHTQLIVHRDLKPSNVFVNRSGEPRVLDFGIAKLLEESADQTQTGTGLRVLSPAYAAPEQILGEAIGTATDVYALALMLCELLVGELPLRRRAVTPAQLAQEVTHETVERASTLASRLPPERAGLLYGAATDTRRLAHQISGDLDLIIATALQRDPARRYATAAAFADDLRRWLTQRPITARADAASYRLLKFIRRHRVGVAASALIVASLVAGLGTALWQARRAQVAAETALRAEEKALQQAEIATAVSDFLTRDVIQAANPYRGKLDIRLTDALIKAAPRIDERFAGKPRLAGVVRRELADSLFLAGELAASQSNAEQALATLEGAFGGADPDVIASRTSLTRVLHRMDRYVDAKLVAQKGLDALGPDAPPRLRLPLQVAMAGLEMEDREETKAVEDLDRLIPQVVAEFGAIEPVHIDVLDHKMRSLMGLERYDDALAIVRELRSGTEKKFGVGDPRTLEWIKREAIILTQLERYDEALVIAQQACDATRATLGENHYATHDCNMRLAIVQFEKKQFGAAVALMEPVAAFRERTYGKDAEGTWLASIWLARAYQRTDQVPRARELFERVYASAIRLNGETDNKTLPFGQTLGMFLEQTGNHVDAEKLRRKLLSQSKASLPAGHISIAKYAWDLGETLASEKRDTETVAFLEEWMPQWDHHFPIKDSRRVDAHQWLADARQRLAATTRH
ncbi:MAG: serine/threonine-protein kinase [Tahibacter sp.]